MPKFPTMPYLFDDLKSISISTLRKWKYLNQNHLKRGVLTWNVNGEKTGSITIEVLMNDDTNFVQLKYTCNDTKYDYTVQLVSLPSNIGNGKIWYFVCPFTFKRCRILHLIDEVFKHRSGTSYGMYKKQTESKKWRQIERVYGCYFDVDKYYKELNKKYFKTHYKGKPTKRYLKIMSKINQAEKFSSFDIEMLLLSK